MTTTATRLFDRQVRDLQRMSQKPSLQVLAYALRNPDVWPKNFRWNYGRTDCCAMALAGKLWPTKFSATPSLIEMQSVFNLSPLIAYKLFFGGGRNIWLGAAMLSQPTTSKSIADAIDTYLQDGDPLMMLIPCRKTLSGNR